MRAEIAAIWAAVSTASTAKKPPTLPSSAR